ncbi:uncharacterized protein Z518_04307 [Rhinocladiella mackenziei CBS 650.93]|uniref:Uncharacterized protein n=1 Tax=Rhinocladiella mackenziei CBS 650.93 TaxID=1442369 RepID=A0A0D2IT11_9EURO|nr:uncharacterized protein Z518_04307 [Rhinocladiella mackenziei CBS 650.93]KIX06331.1 hypothetical protein Z518_04307 [Rhinocladiella mackenziei CBS 650.93]
MEEQRQKDDALSANDGAGKKGADVLCDGVLEDCPTHEKDVHPGDSGTGDPPTSSDPDPATPIAEFKFDSLDPRLRCQKPDCRTMTSCWDPAVVICPACGTDSFVRYCKKQHLYDDIQRHWLYECGKARIIDPIDRDTIRPSQIPNRPYIVSHRHNLVERHRQAVWRAMEDADYFIFNDVDMVDSDILDPTEEEWSLGRGTGTVVMQILFPEDVPTASRRQLFNHHILQCLTFGSPMATPSCMIALQLIRESLIVSGNWTEQMLTYLCMQLGGEWGGFRVPWSFYNVAEVNIVWMTRGLLPLLPPS